MAHDLEKTLAELYASEIHCTITWLWDGGVDYAFVSPKAWDSMKSEDCTMSKARSRTSRGRFTIQNETGLPE
jgi:hypothetical protein